MRYRRMKTGKTMEEYRASFNELWSIRDRRIADAKEDYKIHLSELDEDFFETVDDASHEVEDITANAIPQTFTGALSRAWRGEEPYPSSTVTMTTVEAGRIDFREGLPWALYSFRLLWQGPFDPRKGLHWRVLWGLDIFAGRVPIVKTMIAVSVVIWLLVWLALR